MSKIVEFRSPAGALLRQVSESEQAEPWFIAKDVCEALDIDQSNARRALRERDQGEVKLTTPGGSQLVRTISEAGLYRLALRSRKAEALAFADWVTDEVLPEIRRTGGYRAQTTQTADPALAQMAAAITVLAQGLMTLQAQVTKLAEQRTQTLTSISGNEAAELSRRLSCAADLAHRVGMAESRRSARTAFETRIRRACGWSRYRGAQIQHMPATAWPYARVEMCEIEADVQRARQASQRGLFDASNKPN